MNHKYKTAIFKCLDVLPSRLGFSLYHSLQNVFSPQNLKYKIASTQQSFDLIIKILNKKGINIENKHITELGSGWLPILPYFFRFKANAKSIESYDINQHYEVSEIKKLNAVFSETYTIPSGSFNGAFKLPQDIQYYPKTDICTANLKNTDLVVSRFVLEHVSPQIIKEIHNSFVSKLKPGCFILHLISPSDHRAYSDKKLSLYDFLKYSHEEWNSIQTKFDYHNRLRLPEYIELFENDFEIIDIEYVSCKVESEQFEKFKLLEINEFYDKYSDEELTAGGINILLKVR